MRAWYWPASPAAVEARGRASRSWFTAWVLLGRRHRWAGGVQRGLVQGEGLFDVATGLPGQVRAVVPGAPAEAARHHRHRAHRQRGSPDAEPSGPSLRWAPTAWNGHTSSVEPPRGGVEEIPADARQRSNTSHSSSSPPRTRARDTGSGPRSTGGARGRRWRGEGVKWPTLEREVDATPRQVDGQPQEVGPVGSGGSPHVRSTGSVLVGRLGVLGEVDDRVLEHNRFSGPPRGPGADRGATASLFGCRSTPRSGATSTSRRNGVRRARGSRDGRMVLQVRHIARNVDDGHGDEATGVAAALRPSR